MKRIKVVVTLLLLSFVSVSRAQVIGTHQGSKNPLSEGWQIYGPHVGVNSGQINNDLGLGIDAWAVYAKGPSYEGVHGIHLTSQQLAMAAVSDWKLSTNLRVEIGPPSSSPAEDAVVHVAVHFHERRYSMVFGKEAT